MAVSIVDYIKSTGGDSSYMARKKLAEQQGIAGYRGTAEQNMRLLKGLQGGAGSNQNGVSSNVLAGTGLKNANAPATSGTVTNVTSSSGMKTYPTRGYIPSKQVEDAYSRMKSYDRNLPADYSESKYVEGYRKKLGDIERNKPDPFVSKYSNQITDLLNQVYGEKKFSYTGQDMKNDDLYKAYAEQYENNARRAMQDTLGNASALTGGYGSTYGQAAAQQQYDQTMAGLNSRALDFYDRAYQRYQDDRANRYNQLNAFNNQDQIDYGRYRDTVGDWKDDRNYYQNALNAERSADLQAYGLNNTNYWNGANYLADQYNNFRNQDFGAYQQDEANAQWEKQYEMSKQQLAMQQAQNDLDNELKRLQIQKAQMDLAGVGYGGARGSGGGRRSGKGKQRNTSGISKGNSYLNGMNWSAGSGEMTKPMVEASQFNDEYMDLLANKGKAVADDYRDFVKNNGKIYYGGIQDKIANEKISGIKNKRGWNKHMIDMQIGKNGRSLREIEEDRNKKWWQRTAFD